MPPGNDGRDTGQERIAAYHQDRAKFLREDIKHTEGIIHQIEKRRQRIRDRGYNPYNKCPARQTAGFSKINATEKCELEEKRRALLAPADEDLTDLMYDVDEFDPNAIWIITRSKPHPNPTYIDIHGKIYKNAKKLAQMGRWTDSNLRKLRDGSPVMFDEWSRSGRAGLLRIINSRNTPT